MSKMASNFGKFFSSIGKKKPPVPIIKPSSVKSKEEDSEEESYEDPTAAFPTEAPVIPHQVMPVMPNYPPPRLNNSGKKRDDYADPYDSKENGVVSPQPCNLNSSNYADPFDAKISDKNKVLKSNNDSNTDDDDGYDSPYETQKCIKNKTIDNQDNYSMPWDMSKTTPTSIHSSKSSVRSIIKQDEYSDPWDSKNSSSPKSQVASYDDTYSEPYDKNKSTIIDQKKLDDESVEDEMEMKFSDKERRWIGISSSKGSIKENSGSIRSSNPPASQDDSQGDYDAPWDWKLKKAGKVTDDACSVGAKDRNSTITNDLSEHSDRRDSSIKRDKSSVKNTETRFVENVDQNDPGKAYEVDPTIPLLNQGWFHGRIRRGEAEKLLDAEPDCSYLIRNSESSKTDYSLSIRNNGVAIHLKISYKEGKYILGVNSRPFQNIPEMIHYYSMNKLNIRGAEQVKLQYPKLQEAVYFTVLPGT